MGVSGSCVFLWIVYLFFGISPSVWYAIKGKGEK